MIENQSGPDWKDVELTLISGRPVPFTRPSTRPTTSRDPKCRSRWRDWPDARRRSRRRGGEDDGSALPPAPHPAPAPLCSDRWGAIPDLRRPVVRCPVRRSIRGDRRRDPGQLQVPRTQVDLANGRTLSIPILDRQMPAERLALYQADTAARNPLAAIRLTNDGETGLPPGILTLYERDKAGSVSYVGDARPVGLPRRRDPAPGLCAGREDHGRARRRAVPAACHRHDRRRCARASSGASARPRSIG